MGVFCFGVEVVLGVFIFTFVKSKIRVGSSLLGGDVTSLLVQNL